MWDKCKMRPITVEEALQRLAQKDVVAERQHCATAAAAWGKRHAIPDEALAELIAIIRAIKDPETGAVDSLSLYW